MHNNNFIFFIFIFIICDDMVFGNNDNADINTSNNEKKIRINNQNNYECEDIISKLMEYLKQGNCLIQKEEKDEFVCNETCLQLFNGVLRKVNDECDFEKSSDKLFPTTSKEYLCSLYKNNCEEKKDENNNINNIVNINFLCGK